MTTIADRAPARVVVAHRRANRITGHRATVLLRCGLYFGLFAAAVAGGAVLGRPPRAVPVMALLLGWATAQALTYAGAVASRRAGTRAGVRLVAAGLLTMAVLWSIAVAVAPTTAVGPDRRAAAAIGVSVLTAFATVTAALVGRTEAEVVRWSIPMWALGALVAAGLWPAGVPIEAPLAAAIAIAAARALRPALGNPPPVPVAVRFTVADLRRSTGYLLLGAGQAAAVAWVWRLGPDASPPPGLVPLVLAVPMLEAFVGWHAAQVRAGLDGCDTVRAYARHLRGVAAVTLAALVPPLAVGVALAAAAHRLPYGLAGHQQANGVVLALAAGTLLSGVFAGTLLLAVRGRLGRAVAIALAAPLAAAALSVAEPGPAGAGAPSVLVGVLAVTHIAGIVAVAYTALDHRRAS